MGMADYYISGKDKTDLQIRISGRILQSPAHQNPQDPEYFFCRKLRNELI